MHMHMHVHMHTYMHMQCTTRVVAADVEAAVWSDLREAHRQVGPRTRALRLFLL